MNIKQVLYRYKNGNYTVTIFSDGSKSRFTLDDDFISEFPESIDLKITEYCDLNCPMCHEASTISGKHAKLDAKFLDTLVSGTELAIGGGNPLSHPELESFLSRLKDKGIIANITINEKHLLKNEEYVQHLIDDHLIYGLGISLSLYDPSTFKFASKNHNTVFHLIAGLIPFDKLETLESKYKALILGYKVFGRGENYYSKDIEDNIKYLENNFKKLSEHFSSIGFDNLAIKQLHVKDHVSPATYEKFYMGDDGEFTMYIDLVKRQFAKNSTSTIRYELKDDVRSMLDIVKKERK